MEEERERDGLAYAARAFAEDVPLFVREELALLKAEGRRVAVRAALGGLAAFVALTGLVFLAVSAATAISQATGRAHLGTLVVGLALLVVGGATLPLAVRAGRAER